VTGTSKFRRHPLPSSKLPLPPAVGEGDGGRGYFLYGTLRPDLLPSVPRRWRVPRTLAARATPVAPATVAGRLYDLGDYPGLALESDAGRVVGWVCDVPDDLVPALDRFEGLSPIGLYVRVRATATLADGTTRECWVYALREVPSSAVPVESGDWAAALARRAAVPLPPTGAV